MSLQQITIEVRKGSSADIALRIESSTMRFAAITGMQNSAPLRVTAPNHGIFDMWHAAVIDATGMVELNAADSNAIGESEFHQVTVVDANTLDFNGISSAGFSAYISGGHLAYYAPFDLSGYTSARMDIKRRVGGTIELALNTTDGTLAIDPATSTVWIHLSEAKLSTLVSREYVFDIELIRAGGIDAICSAESVFEVLPEVTTST